MAPVTLQNVRKSYGSLEVIHGIDIEIEDGEFVILVGPSGCGKSTLLRMVAGLERITDGTVVIGDKIVNDAPPKDRDIAMVFQDYALYPHMTVSANMSFSLRLRGENKDAIKKRIEEAADILGLSPFLDRYPRQLSGGQRQRVAMGRALVRNPQVFLFDEPLSNLDAKLRVAMRTEIKALQQRLGTTTIYVTHDQIEAMTMAQRVVVMRDGEVEQTGTPLELYDKPRNIFVAGFIGSPSMNFLKGHIVANSSSWFETEDGCRLPVPENIQLKHGRPVTYGVRPEHLTVGEKGIEVKVNVIEPTGSEMHIFARAGSQDLNVLLHQRRSVRPGEVIRLWPDVEAVHLFDIESGNRL